MHSFLTLSELTQEIKQALESQLAPSYWVVCEISDLRLNQSGHCYLELVESADDQILAKLRGTIWAYAYRAISQSFAQATGTPLQAGIKILAQVTVNFHDIYGLSISIRAIDPNFTLGERERQKAEVISQLERDGLLQKNKEIPLPLVPIRIAVVSSPTAAGLGDFMQQLADHVAGYGFHVVLFPTIMQGEKAAHSIKSAFDKINRKASDFDVAVIIRGGGATTDLDAFNSYAAAEGIATCMLPVLSGIGHQRDQTVVDLVSYSALKTPTAVAQFLLEGVLSFEESLNRSGEQLAYYLNREIQLQLDRLHRMEHEVKMGILGGLQARSQQLTLAQEKLKQGIRLKLDRTEKKLDLDSLTINQKWKGTLSTARAELDHLEKLLAQLNPEIVFSRGYSMTFVEGKPVGMIKMDKNVILQTLTSDLEIISKVEKWQKK